VKRSGKTGMTMLSRIVVMICAPTTAYLQHGGTRDMTVMI
jgi:hypothetical protein